MSTIYGNSIIIGKSKSTEIEDNSEVTSLSVVSSGDGLDAPIFCLWQTSNGWMGTGNFDTAESFTVPNVIVGGYVIFTKSPDMQAYFSTYSLV